MGALNGSLSATKYYVEGELPKDVRRSYMERIRLRVFAPLKAEEEAEERAGWCGVGQGLELDLSPDKVFNGPYLTLGLRVDRYRFPPAVVNAELARMSRELLQKSGQERLSRTQKSELKARVQKNLRRKYPPSMQVVDVVWHLDRGQLFFWSQNAAFNDRLGALFELSFGLELTIDSPYAAALRLNPEPKQRAALQDVALTSFHGKG